jgi:hypothetical protein
MHGGPKGGSERGPSWKLSILAAFLKNWAKTGSQAQISGSLLPYTLVKFVPRMKKEEDWMINDFF